MVRRQATARHWLPGVAASEDEILTCGKADFEGVENYKSTAAIDLEGKAYSRLDLSTCGKGASSLQ